MKGYKTSQNYERLWALIQDGYEVIGLYLVKHAPVRISLHKMTNQPIIGENCFNSQDDFIEACKDSYLKYIPPETEPKTKLSDPYKEDFGISSEDTPSEGDKAIITSNILGHQYEIGEKVELVEFDESENWWRCRNDNGDYWGVTEMEFKLIND